MVYAENRAEMGKNMTYPTLYRKRILPQECIRLKDDVILTCNEDIILTKWNALKPKKDLHHGYSCYFLKEGYKVSQFLREDDSLLYWYCDIVEYLLADVIIYPDGYVKVMDLDELVTTLDQGALTQDLLKKCLTRLNSLLQIIYGGNFHTLQKYIEDIKD